jgi:hypothetical protein
MTERKYRMTRVYAGDWLLPSNDATTLWRITRYHEDGSLSRGDDHAIVGWFWQTWRRPMPKIDVYLDVTEWDGWQHWEGPFDTRAEAVGACLRQTAVVRR